MPLEPSPTLSADLQQELLIRVRTGGDREKVSLPQLSVVQARPRYWGDANGAIAVEARSYVPESKLARVEAAVKQAISPDHPLNAIEWRLQSPPRPYALG